MRKARLSNPPAYHLSASCQTPAFLNAGLVQWFQLNRLAAATGRRLVGIIEYELGRKLIYLPIHLGAEHIHHSHGIDEQLNAIGLDQLVVLADLFSPVERILPCQRIRPF